MIDPTQLTIERGVPIPPSNSSRYKGETLSSKIRQMQVGDSILIPKTQTGLYGHFHRIPGKFVTRKIDETSTRVWRVE